MLPLMEDVLAVGAVQMQRNDRASACVLCSVGLLCCASGALTLIQTRLGARVCLKVGYRMHRGIYYAYA